MKQYRVTDVSKKKIYLILFETFETFVKKCKAKFHISDDVNVFFVSEDDEEAEIESEILEKVHGNKSLLIMKCDRSEQSHWRESQDEKAVFGARRKDRYQGKEESSSEEDQQKSAPRTRNIEEHETKEWREAEEGTAIKAHIRKFGLKDIGNVLKKNLEKWKEIPLHIAVTGASGKGKSSFINAMRRVSAGDHGAAKVDVTDCTTTPTPYRHPDIHNFVLWDVPGVGTINFPKESYLNEINADKYDFFIVIFRERFTETESWLLHEIRKRNKRCYLVRTKIDIDMENRKHSGKPNHSFLDLKKDMRDEIVKSFKGRSSLSFPFFVISNHNILKYDFQLLEF
ncbi:T-cell-specific guanine nucleotide triphosphate-binding protein 2-like [Mercenaria mercenaria]|uniref:T-cell-specific guanine nucleotide triphosphate-binding protein 2-like n=1 Tax=Mercenaria mercenaria TaxID=6596 RepID=UPI00234EAB55|nr:T-cell-specific guanine nucleotide triphosphate-binding protein 2-like [Mercenaria mercenaria]